MRPSDPQMSFPGRTRCSSTAGSHGQSFILVTVPRTMPRPRQIYSRIISSGITSGGHPQSPKPNTPKTRRNPSTTRGATSWVRYPSPSVLRRRRRTIRGNLTQQHIPRNRGLHRRQHLRGRRGLTYTSHASPSSRFIRASSLRRGLPRTLRLHRRPNSIRPSSPSWGQTRVSRSPRRLLIPQTVSRLSEGIILHLSLESGLHSIRRPNLGRIPYR